MNEQTTIPVKENDQLIVKIQSEGTKGDGITEILGFIIIVPNTKKDKTYKIKITKIHKKYAFAQQMEEIK